MEVRPTVLSCTAWRGSWNSKAMDFYKSDKVGARERVGDDGTTWVNFIMEREAIAKLAS